MGQNQYGCLINKRLYWFTFYFFILNAETFGASKEKEKCVENCAQPCTYTKYETSLSYSGLQRNVFINKLNSAAKETAIYEHFLNMSTSKKKEYIE